MWAEEGREEEARSQELKRQNFKNKETKINSGGSRLILSATVASLGIYQPQDWCLELGDSCP